MIRINKNQVSTALLTALLPLAGMAQIKPTATVGSPTTLNTVTARDAYPATIKVNLIRTWEAMAPNTNPTAADLANPAKYKQATAYFDGLGRPLQEVVKGASPDRQKDLVTVHAYDALGREALQYLPYAVADATAQAGKFKLNAFAEQMSYHAGSLPNVNTAAEPDQRPWGKTVFEASPLNRPVVSFAPGNSWAGSEGSATERAVKKQYLINTAADAVRIWNIGYDAIGDATNIPSTNTTYLPGQLYKNVNVDEHGKQVVEYVDKEGKVLLKKVQLAAAPESGHGGWLCTYYIYDDLGLLRFVIQPKGVEWLIANGWTFNVPVEGLKAVQGLCFRYEYDARQRMIAKQVPGAGWVYMVYDKRDRLVFTQDANLRSGASVPGGQPAWLTNFYDALNRPTATALYRSAQNRSQLQTILDGLTMENPTPTIAEADLYRLSFTYYDDYTFSGAAAFNSAQLAATQANYQLGDETAQNTGMTTLTRGLVTGTRVRILTDGVSGAWNATPAYNLSTNYYDVKGRPLQVISTNHKNGTDVVTTQYSFTGKVLSTTTLHNNPAATLAGTQNTTIQQTTLYSNNYAISTRQRINNDAWHAISTIQYDDLGKAKRKEMGEGYTMDGQAEKFFTNFSYNIRGWLTGINKDQTAGLTNQYAWLNGSFFKPIFSQLLSYDAGFETAGGTATNSFNGNISGQVWMHAGNKRRRAFGYEYDNANRITKADYTEDQYGWRNTSMSNWAENDYSVKSISYDANGNILSLDQWGSKPNNWGDVIDKLIYSIETTGNRLKAVEDKAPVDIYNMGDFKDGNKFGDDYDYDANGNMTMDKNKKITSVKYNHLNLPVSISITDKGTITYLYDAAGNKLQKIVTPTLPPAGGAGGGATDYLGAFLYQNNELQQVAHAEGRVRYAKRQTYDGPSELYFWNYDHYYKDHLGNIRTTVTEAQDQSRYKVTTEEEAESNELQFTWYSTKDVVKTEDIPNYTGTKQEDRVLRTLTGDKSYMGYNTVLKVMAGDKVDVKVDHWYNLKNSYDQPKIDDWYYWGAFGFLNQAFGTGAGAIDPGHLNAEEISGSSSAASAWSINTFLNNRDETTDPNRPKAFLNWLFLDERMMISPTGSGSIQVSTSPADFNGDMNRSNITVPVSGYLYVWVSNESNTPVFFDNLVINHRTGPLLQENDYYPFGLEMKLLSSKAGGKAENRYKYNGKEEQADFDLDWMDYGARMYDGQIGRWHVVDPLTDKMRRWSPYVYAFNNPLRFIDPDGMLPQDSIPQQETNIPQSVGLPDNAVIVDAGVTAEQIFEIFQYLVNVLDPGNSIDDSDNGEDGNQDFFNFIVHRLRNGKQKLSSTVEMEDYNEVEGGKNNYTDVNDDDEFTGQINIGFNLKSAKLLGQTNISIGTDGQSVSNRGGESGGGQLGPIGINGGTGSGGSNAISNPTSANINGYIYKVQLVLTMKGTYDSQGILDKGKDGSKSYTIVTNATIVFPTKIRK